VPVPAIFKGQIHFERIRLALAETNLHANCFHKFSDPFRQTIPPGTSPQEFLRRLKKHVEIAISTTLPFNLEELLKKRGPTEHFLFTDAVIMAICGWQFNTSIQSHGNDHWRSILSDDDVQQLYAGTMAKEEFEAKVHKITLQKPGGRLSAASDKPPPPPPRTEQLNTFAANSTGKPASQDTPSGKSDAERYAERQ
jgi:hypothetical protein